MTAQPDPFEHGAKAAFDDSIARLDAATRSRLTQARHAALAVGPRRELAPWWRNAAPAGGLAAAVLVALVLWNRSGAPVLPDLSTAQTSRFDDLELIADADALDLADVDNFEFYEWAATQDEGADEGNGEVRGT
ncbi:MAG: hypothetical protein ABIT36_01565 [Steroidobacteraceae bacterium]